MKNLTLIVVLLVVVVGGIGAYAMMSNNSSVTQSGSTTTAPSSGEAALTESQNYLPFSPTVLASSTSSRRVLFFYANWCPSCKVANDEFSEQSAQLPDDVTLIRVNYNDTDTDQVEKDLAKKYTVTYQHTFVQIDAEGNEVTKWNGGELTELQSNLK